MTKATIIKETPDSELKALRQRIAELEARETDYKKAEQVLRDSEDKFRTLTENSVTCIFIVQLGKLCYVNPTCARSLGYLPEEMAGKLTAKDLIHPDDIQTVMRRLQVRLEGEKGERNNVYKAIRKDGSVAYMEVYGTTITYQGKPALMGTIIDITERRRTEEFLRQSEERLRTMMEGSSEGFALHDGEKVFDINKNGARMFGYERSEMIGKNTPDFVAPESLDLIMKNIAKCYEQSYEALFKKKDGSTFPVEIRARNITYKGKDTRLVTFRDLTVQKQYNNLLENISVNAPTSMYIVQNGRFKFVNKQFCRETGRTEQELLAIDIMEGVCQEDRALTRNNTIQMLKGKRTEPYEFRTVAKNGEVRWVLQSVAPIVYNNQRAYIATYLDITEQRKTAAALITSEQTLKQAQTLGRIGNWEFDLAMQKIEWSDEVYRLYERDKAVGPPSPEEEASYYPPEQAARLREYSHLAIEKGEEFNYDLTAYLPSGKTAFFNAFMYPVKDDKGQVIKLFGTVQDITERKQAEEKYSNIIETATDGFWITSMEGKFIDVNDSYCQMIGYRREELLTMSISDIEAVEKPEEIARRIKNIEEQGFDRFETKHRCQDGKVIDVEVRVKHYNIEKGQLVVFIRDITERKQAEENLRRLTTRLKELLVAIPDIIMEVNSNKVYTWGNQAAIDFFGDDVIGKEAAFYFEGEQNTYDVVKPLFDGNEGTFYVESWQRRKDGQKRLLAWQCRVLKGNHGNVRGALSSAQDITERRQAEEAMRDNEENLKTYLENAPDGVYLSDLKGVFLYGNKKAEKILGYKKEELIGSNFLKLHLLPAKYLVKAAELLTLNAIGRNTGPDEFELIRNDESHIWVEINTAPTKDKGKTVIIGFVRDITERKRTDEALKASEEKFRSAMDNSPLGIILHNTENEILYANQAMLDIYGYASVDELKAVPLKERYTPESYARFLRGDRRRRGEENQNNYEVDIIRNDGTIRNLQVFRKDIKVGGTRQYQLLYNDITEQRHAEKALEESEKKYSTLVEKGNDGIIVIRDGLLAFTNSKALEMVGFTANEVLGKRFDSFISLEFRDLLKQRYQKRIAGESIPSSYEAAIVAKDGRIIPIEINANTIEYAGKQSDLAIVRDITERKQAEQLYHALTDNSPVSVYIIQDNRFVFTNQTLQEHTGYTENELLNVSTTSIIHPEDRQNSEANMAQMLKGNRLQPYEYRFMTKSGETKWVLTKVSSITYQGKRAMMGITVDITERKQVEQALKASEENFRNSLDNSALGIRIIDVDGHTFYANRAFLDMVGYDTIDEYAAIPTQKRYTPEEYAHYLVRLERRKHGQLEENKFEVNIVRKDGSTRWLQCYNKEMAWDGKNRYQLIYEDITERKQAEQLYHTLTDNSPVSVYIIQDDRFVFTNQTLQQNTGYTEKELLNVSPIGIIHPEDRQMAEVNAVQMLKGNRLQPYEYRFMTKSGETRWAMAKVAPITYQGKQAMMGITVDITERKQVEETLKASEEKYRNSLDSSPLGIRIADMDGHTIYTNQAFLDIYGFKDIEEYRTTPPQKRLTPEGYASYLLEVEKRKRNEKIENNLEVNIMRKDGSSGWLQVSSKEMFWDGKKQYQSIYEDITERKQAEQLYHTLADSSTVGVYIVQNKKFVFTNPAYQMATGFTAEELLTTNTTNLVHPEDWENVRQRAVQMLKGERLRSYEFRLITKSGEIRGGLERLTAITYQGKPAHLGNFLDITERKLAEQALRQSKDSLDEAQKLAHIGSFEINMKTGKNEWSEELFNIFGLDPAKTTPTIKSFLSSVHPDDRKLVAKSMKLTTSQNQVPNIEYRIVTPDGRERYILSQIKTTCDANGQPLTAFGTSMDITERKQAQDEISRSYRIQSAINVLLKVSLEDLSLEEILKRSIDLVLSMPWFTFESRGSIFLVEDDPKVLVMKAQNGLAQPIQRECARIPFGRCICGQAALTQEMQFVDCLNEHHETRYDGIIPHGHYCVPILSADKVLGVINVYVKEGHRRNKREEEFLNAAADALAGVIERKRAQERIERAAEEWRTTFDSITDCISIHDKDNRILRVNKAMADILKTTPKELIGKFCHEVMHGTKEPPANCPHLQTLKTVKPAATEYLNSKLEIHFHEATSPLFNEQGEVTGSVIVARDITKQKRMEEQLIVTDRLASIGELASGIAHELNNPLTSVIGFSQLLMEGDIPPNMKEDLGTVYSEAQRAAVIVKNLLTFARKHAPVKQLSQVNTIVEDVLRLRAYEQKVNNIEVDKRLATNLPDIMADHFQLQQVFLNIIVNAEFAMQEAHGKGKLVITTERSNGVVKVAITDDGPGIAEDNLKRIFDPFFTTKEVGKGTGLGLSICHGIVTEHGGKIYVRSEKGKGATFVVELPLN